MSSDLQGPPREGPPASTGGGGTPDPEAYLRAAASPQFIELRRRYRGFAFPMTVAFLTWYFAFVLAAVFAPAWMATPVWGEVNRGIVFGLLQFVTTGLITFLYVRHANNRLDPLAAEIRDEMEAGTK
jgi:uncharacterized membrane protein (DUF485 family)